MSNRAVVDWLPALNCWTAISIVFVADNGKVIVPPQACVNKFPEDKGRTANAAPFSRMISCRYSVNAADHDPVVVIA